MLDRANEEEVDAQVALASCMRPSIGKRVISLPQTSDGYLHADERQIERRYRESQVERACSGWQADSWYFMVICQ